MLKQFISTRKLPESFAATANDYYIPLSDWVERNLVSNAGLPRVLGINGAQGAGKTTLSHFIAEYLQHTCGRRVATFSIDDIYLSRDRRRQLADKVHPLLATRGVPGTHDPLLGLRIIAALRALKSGDSFRVPRFDKLADDHFPKKDWPSVHGPIDLIVFEGWCIGAEPECDQTLVTPINALEEKEDPDVVWRKYVNGQLSMHYRDLFAQIDSLVYLRVPDFASVKRWRCEQERKLAGAGMTDDQLARFMLFFERITRNSLTSIPPKASVVLDLNREHQVAGVHYRPRGHSPE